MTSLSILHDLETTAGAIFMDFCGGKTASHFGNPDKEYDALVHSAAVLNLCFRGRLRVTGKDRVRFLNGQLTNDIRTLTSGCGCYAALLTRQGLLEADLWVYGFSDQLWLECPPGTGGRVLSSLSRYVVSDAVEFEDISEAMGVLSLQGPRAGEIMERTTGTSIGSLHMFDHQTIQKDSATWEVVCRDHTGCGGYDLWLPTADLAGVWQRWVEMEKVQLAGFQAWDRARTEAGIPWYGIDMDEKSIPMEMGLDAAISMKKGCYRGQEIVARIIHRGHLDRRLAGISLDTRVLPVKGADVRADGAKIGRITSAVMSPRLGKPLALAVLKQDFLVPETRVEVECGGEFRPGCVVALPLRR